MKAKGDGLRDARGPSEEREECFLIGQREGRKEQGGNFVRACRSWEVRREREEAVWAQMKELVACLMEGDNGRRRNEDNSQIEEEQREGGSKSKEKMREQR